MIVEDCVACYKQVSVNFDGDFNRTDYGAIGPYCDVCWFFVEQIEGLKDRVKALEGTAPMHPSPYDLSRRRR